MSDQPSNWALNHAGSAWRDVGKGTTGIVLGVAFAKILDRIRAESFAAGRRSGIEEARKALPDLIERGGAAYESVQRRWLAAAMHNIRALLDSEPAPAEPFDGLTITLTLRDGRISRRISTLELDCTLLPSWIAQSHVKEMIDELTEVERFSEPSTPTTRMAGKLRAMEELEAEQRRTASQRGEV